MHCAHIETAFSLVVYGLEGDGDDSCALDMHPITLYYYANEAGHPTIKKIHVNLWDSDSRRKEASFSTVIETVKLWSDFGFGKTKMS